MLRHLAKTVIVLAVSALPAVAQGHPGSHMRPASHDSLHHAPMDSAQHAALHALMHGTWTGTISDHGVASPFSLSIAHDSVHAALLRATASAPLTLGGAHHMMPVTADTVRWTQDISGVACPATAMVNSHATAKATMDGTIACPSRELRFTLTKSAE